MSTEPLPRKTRTDLDKIIAEVEQNEKQYEGKQMPEDVMRRNTELYAEGEKLSEALNAEMAQKKSMERMKAAQKFGFEVPNPIIPGVAAPNTETVGDYAGYITAGHFAVLSQKFQQWLSNDGMATAAGVKINLPGGLLPVKGRSNGLIGLTETEVKSLKVVREQMETKDLPTFGSLVIAPQRVDRFVQDTRPDTLTLRDVLNVLPTSSNLIQYVAEDSYTEAAAIQSEGTTAATVGMKEEDDVAYVLRDATVKTIATTIPVTEQQLADAPALIGRINTRLLYSVRHKEEQLCAYGSGSGLEFAGFFDSDSGVAAATTPSGSPTLIDKIRAAQTDVMTSGYQPSFVWIHPLDWEAIELTKASTGEYIWAVIRDNIGPRIWSMRVVQGVGAKKVGANTRNVLIGDPIGSVLYDREQANIAVGWVDDQFAKNMRTIRAEERVVLCVDAPAAYRKINTVA